MWGELGRYPLVIDTIISISKYYEHIKKSKNSLLLHALEESISIHDSKIFSWYTFVKKIVESLGLSMSSFSTVNLKKIIRSKFELFWKNHLHSLSNSSMGSKLDLYAEIKCHFKFEEYINTIKTKCKRMFITKLRISNHPLQIERGRYLNPKPPRDERFCPYCQSVNDSLIEDELHFLFDCPLYADLRIPLMAALPPNLLTSSKRDQYFYLVNSEGRTINELAKYCQEGFKLRTSL